MTGKTVFSYKNLEVKVSKETNDEINSLLASTIVGSEGGMQYTMRDIPARIANYGDTIRLVSLIRNFSLAAVIGACYRECVLGSSIHRCTYLRFLSFRQQYQTEKVIRKNARKEKESSTTDTFRNQALRIFSKPHLLDFPGVQENDRHLLYCFVESKNERSKNLIQQAGYEYIRSFLTLAFSRFNPKPDPRVSVITPEEFPVVLEQLRRFYDGYSFYFDPFQSHTHCYHVLRENGRIIAGVSAIPTVYVIRNVPGVWGWIMMKVLPFAPLFRKLFSPGHFRFVSLGSIFYEPGREETLAPLFESVCAASGLNTALTWADDRGPLFDSLRATVRMGALNRMLNAKPGLIYARFLNYSDEEKEKFYDAPAYISGFDFT
jgi:hypothetical protein